MGGCGEDGWHHLQNGALACQVSLRSAAKRGTWAAGPGTPFSTALLVLAGSLAGLPLPLSPPPTPTILLSYRHPGKGNGGRGGEAETPPTHLAAGWPPLPPVLVPGLDLGVRQVEGGRQVHAVLHAQVLLPLEAALQLVELMVREGRPRFAGLLRSHRGAIPAAGDFPVAFFFCPYEQGTNSGLAGRPGGKARRQETGAAAEARPN